jgi:hypothetical protein
MNTTLWVYLAFSAIETRKGALLLVWGCLAFTLYCVPWPLLFTGSDWIARIFLINDWSWFAIMVPVTFWYWISLRWVDNNLGWVQASQD